ncbi:hypothetical protein MRX96_054984 [Rhipicephalus microplus]
MHPDGFQVTTLSANIPVKQHGVSRAALRVKCQASFVGLYEAVGEMAIPVGRHAGDHKVFNQHQRPQHKQPPQRPSHLASISSIQDECFTKAIQVLAKGVGRLPVNRVAPKECSSFPYTH